MDLTSVRRKETASTIESLLLIDDITRSIGLPVQMLYPADHMTMRPTSGHSVRLSSARLKALKPQGALPFRLPNPSKVFRVSWRDFHQLRGKGGHQGEEIADT